MPSENPISNIDNPNKTWSSSMLASILEANKEKTVLSSSLSQEQDRHGPVKEVQKKIREPISLGSFLKIIGSLSLVGIIFFGSFLAYIAFNPSQALFFVNTFGINPNDVQNLLKRLINGSFGIVMLVLSIVWIISLFQAFWIPKELKRKKLLSWLTAWGLGIFLFSILSFWAYLYQIVGATDYTNPAGSILLYDNDLFIREKYTDTSRLYITNNLIGPVNILFDLRSNAEQIRKNALFEIESYEIDFDWAICSNGKSIIVGKNPYTEQSLICTFDKVQTYNVRWTYFGKNRLGEKQEMQIIMPTVEIRGLIDIRKSTNTRGQKIITLDASGIKKLGTPRWIYESSGKETKETSITETLTPIAEAVGLKIWTTENSGLDRIFILEDKDNRSIEWSIQSIQDPIEWKKYIFSLTGVSINQNEIINIEWLLNKQIIICARKSDICEYTFSDYRKNNISVQIELANGQKYLFEKEITIIEPIQIERHVKVFNKNGILLNEDNTYDRALKSYLLKNLILPPESLIFDARDVISANPGYTLDTVLWKISNGKNIEERRGTKIIIDFNQSLRYTVESLYTFKKNGSTDPKSEEIVRDMVIIDIERHDLIPRMSIDMSSDYVPSLVTIDASQSASENGEIKKFIFDFGEWKSLAEWDAIQQYNYTTPGDKTITLTIIDSNGKKESLKKTIVFKDRVKTIDFLPSISPSIVWKSTDFEAVGTTWQIEDYIWSFGDNTEVLRWYNVTHIYSTPGDYTITLTIVYTDGTQKEIKKSHQVIEESK